MQSSPTVVVRNASKNYVVKRDGSEFSIFSRKNGPPVQAVRNASFVAYGGESIGILGQNGSGKSTLLRLIAGAETPSDGVVRVSAQPTLLGVSAALQANLSGTENVRLGLLAMGLEPHSVDSLVPGVIKWAGLIDAAHRPMSTYSAGMRSRLKFSIATAVTREILLVDEALSTGDSTFSTKASHRMREFLSSAGTVFIVSHAAGVIEKFCSRAIWLHEGEIVADGNPRVIAKSYKVWSRHFAAGHFDKASEVIEHRKSLYSPVSILFDSEVAPLLDDIGSTPRSPGFDRYSKLN